MAVWVVSSISFAITNSIIMNTTVCFFSLGQKVLQNIVKFFRIEMMPFCSPSRYLSSTDLICDFLFVNEVKQLNISWGEMYISFSVNCLFLFFTYFPIEFLDVSQFLEVLWEFRLSSVFWAANTFTVFWLGMLFLLQRHFLCT